jgi:DnaK suppressor protein
MQPIEKIRQGLVRRRHGLLHQVDRLESDLRALDENAETELEEEAQGANISRLLAGLDDRGKAEIRAIDEALERIERGEYGTCSDCGEPIPIERLEALPTATTCVQCTEDREGRRA